MSYRNQDTASSQNLTCMPCHAQHSTSLQLSSDSKSREILHCWKTLSNRRETPFSTYQKTQDTAPSSSMHTPSTPTAGRKQARNTPDVLNNSPACLCAESLRGIPAGETKLSRSNLKNPCSLASPRRSLHPPSSPHHTFHQKTQTMGALRALPCPSSNPDPGLGHRHAIPQSRDHRPDA